MMATSAPKILVVDDEPPIRKLLRIGLTAQGYDVLERTAKAPWKCWPRSRRW
jgi:two-component system KDP operon response regulator KdpE